MVVPGMGAIGCDLGALLVADGADWKPLPGAHGGENGVLVQGFLGYFWLLGYMWKGTTFVGTDRTGSAFFGLPDDTAGSPDKLCGLRLPDWQPLFPRVTLGLAQQLFSGGMPDAEFTHECMRGWANYDGKVREVLLVVLFGETIDPRILVRPSPQRPWLVLGEYAGGNDRVRVYEPVWTQ